MTSRSEFDEIRFSHKGQSFAISNDARTLLAALYEAKDGSRNQVRRFSGVIEVQIHTIG